MFFIRLFSLGIEFCFHFFQRFHKSLDYFLESLVSVN